MEHEPKIEVEEVGSIPMPQPQTMGIDDALAIVNGNLGGIIGKLFELLPINLAQAFANDIGQTMGTIREVIAVVKAEKLANAPAPEPLVPEMTEPEKEGEADGTAPDNG